MGVDFYYCGNCCECLHEDCFTFCHFCENAFEHEDGHGRYCMDCGLEDPAVFIKKNFVNIDKIAKNDPEKDSELKEFHIFCSALDTSPKAGDPLERYRVTNKVKGESKCYKQWREEFKQEMIDREKDIGKCTQCGVEKPSYKLHWYNSSIRGDFCDRICYDKYIKEQKIEKH